MKKLFTMFTAWALAFAQLVMVVPVHAQSTIGASRAAGRFIAVNYNYGGAAPSMGVGNPPAPAIPALKIANGNPATGTSTITLAVGYITMPDARIFFPLCAGSTVTGSITCGGATPITVNPGGANQETVTPTAVSGCNLFPVNTTFPSCQVTASFSNLHAQGEFVASGSSGLQEAINDAIASGGGMALIDALWSKAGGTQSMATSWTAPSGGVGVAVEDQRSTNIGYLVPAPGLSRIAAPTALTKAGGAAATLTTSTTGGSIATASTIRFTVTAVDQFGGESAAADDSNANAALVDGAGSTNSYTITAAGVPTGTGIVAYRVYASATGGTTQTETLVPAASLVCGAAPLSPLPASCAPGVAILITALPPTTAPGPPQGTAAAATSLASAHTTVVIKQTGIPPTMLPFNDTAAAGYWPVTVTSATTLVAGFDVMGELPYAAGFFNGAPGTMYRICGGGVVTPTAATVAGTWNIRIGPRENSAGTSGEVAVVPFGWVASTTWTAALYHFDFCTDITVTTQGASGVLEGSATNFCAVISGGAAATNIVTCVDAFNAASTAQDLTQQGVVQFSYVQTAASWTLPQLRYMSIRRL